MKKNVAGLTFELRDVPELDSAHIPFELFIREYYKEAVCPIAIAITREDGKTSVYETLLRGDQPADALYLNKLIKFLLWSRGGYAVKIYGGHEALCNAVLDAYRPGGARAFDVDFMARIYGKPFETGWKPYAERPPGDERPIAVGGHFSGCRIGFDAGGSDHKVSAVIDGQPVYSEEALWNPKEQDNPQYHYQEIVTALKMAASHLPRVDAIGVSSAGVYVGNEVKAASLFIKVPQDVFDAQVRDIYVRAAGEIGANLPLVVANDGDVAALAGAISRNRGNILGLAMGTSEAVGFVDGGSNILGWLNELAFAPVDLAAGAPQDDWSLDVGCGVTYFSQEAVIRLAAAAGITLSPAAKAHKLKEVQALADAHDARAVAIFRTIGCYVGHAAALYRRFYDARLILLMGRVTAGRGGDLILVEAIRVLRNSYPDITDLEIALPDEAARRMGQSIAAASLPK